MTDAVPRRTAEPATVTARLLARWHEAPDDTTVIFREPAGDDVITRDTLLRRSADWAARYRAAGLGRGSLVIVLLDHRPDMLFSYIGALMLGCIPSYMPYSTAKQDPGLYRSAHLALFRRIRAQAIVTVDAWIAEHGAAFAGEGLMIINADEPTLRSGLDPAEAIEDVGPDDVALLQHSSGTTSLKKGIALNHRSILAQVDVYGDCIGIGERDVIVSWLPLYHDMGLMACFVLPLIRGVPVVMLDPFVWVRRPEQLLAAIETFGGTFCWLPNFAFLHLVRSCAEGRAYNLSSMRAIINCSEPCKEATFAQFEAAFRRMGAQRKQLQTCYAMAETTYAVTQSRLDEPVRHLAIDAALLSLGGEIRMREEGGTLVLSVGRPIEGTAIRVSGEAGEILPERHMGEVWLRSSSLFSGYFALPEETERSFSRGWYRTGDLGFLADGELFITGRLKEMFIIRGRNVFAHEVESVVNACAGVKPGRAVAVGVFNEAIGSEDVVVIAESEIQDPVQRRRLSTGIKQALEQQCGLQARTVELVAPGWLIKTTSGKINRKDNLDKYQAELKAADMRIAQAAAR